MTTDHEPLLLPSHDGGFLFVTVFYPSGFLLRTLVSERQLFWKKRNSLAFQVTVFYTQTFSSLRCLKQSFETIHYIFPPPYATSPSPSPIYTATGIFSNPSPFPATIEIGWLTISLILTSLWRIPNSLLCRPSGDRRLQHIRAFSSRYPAVSPAGFR